MRGTKKRRVRKVFLGRAIRLSKARLDALVQEATVDAYNEAEQVLGLFTMMEDNLQLPFEIAIFGLKVTVERIDLTEGDEIVAVCKRSGKREKVPILDLSLPAPPPEGAEWIAAYRYWRRGLQ